MAHVGLDGFQLAEDAFDGCPAGGSLVRAILHLLPIMPKPGKRGQFRLCNEAKRTDNLHVELRHPEFRRHGAERSLVGQVQKQCLQDVVLMVSQSNLPASDTLRNLKERFASHPRTEETGRMASVGRRVKLRLLHDERNAVCLAHLPKIRLICRIRDIPHPHMCRHQRKLRAKNTHPPAGPSNSTKASESLPPDKPTSNLSPSAINSYARIARTTFPSNRRSNNSSSVFCAIYPFEITAQNYEL